MDNREIHFVINTTEGSQAVVDWPLCAGPPLTSIAYFTTLRGAESRARAIAVQKRGDLRVASLQSYVAVPVS